MTQAITKVAVLGAGVMGAQIAALLANAGIKTLLYDLPSETGDPNAIIKQSLQRLTKLKPAPLASTGAIAAITPANYDDDLKLLNSCQLIIEVIAERLDLKKSLFGKIAPHINEHAILASNTSGLGINELAQHMNPKLRPRFCGVHFFNPPRYMSLVELIANDNSDATILVQLEEFLVSTIGKSVLYAKDTPNFIANRVGVFSMLSVIHHAEQFNIPLEIVDALTGSILGRPKSATLRTADVVGLDTMGYVVNTMAEHLTIDPWAKYYVLPEWVQALVKQGALGQKTGAGIYKKDKAGIHVLDIASKDYRLADKIPDEAVLQILAIRDPAERFAALYKSEAPQAQFLWSHFRDLFHYCAVHGASISHSLRDIDLALRWGFGWKEGPLTTWQLAGWQTIIDYINADIDAGKTMADTPLPHWLSDKSFQGVYTTKGAYAPEDKTYRPRSQLAVYQRQIFPDPVLGETYPSGETLFENDSIRCWHMGDDIAIVSFKTKMNTINESVLAGIEQAVEVAEQDFKGLILWQQKGTHFSVGADLKGFATAVKNNDLPAIETMLVRFQTTALKLRYAKVPTIAAVKGMVFGGGCELMMHCSHTIAACETYIGLVEAGVGLLPAGGGTKEFALRAAKQAGDGSVIKAIQPYYMQIAKAEVTASGIDAQQRDFIKATDKVIFNPHELLYVAKKQVEYLHDSAYQAPLPTTFRVAGKSGIATLQTALVNMREGQFISEYDYYLATKIATVICGGTVESNSEVDEAWILRLEREVFLELAVQEKTQARIAHTLKTGKPLRN